MYCMDKQIYKTQPYKHQQRAIEKARRQEAFAYLMEMGTGKTWVVINEVAGLWGDGSVNGLFVVAPNGVHQNWVLKELPTHMPDWVRWRAVSWNAGANKKQMAEIESILGGTDSSELRILTMNWEALQTKRGQDFAREFHKSVTKLYVAADEIQKMKNPQTARFKAMMELKKHTTFRRGMSGSVVLNSPFDLFAPFSWLSEHILRTTSFFAFKGEYADMLPASHPLVANIKEKSGTRGTPQVVATNKDGTPKYKNLEKLAAIIEPHSFRILKTECLDLPEKVYTQSFFNMEGEQLQAYKLMAGKARMQMADGEVVAVEKLASLMKLSQITSGFLMSPGGEILKLSNVLSKNPKMQLLQQRLEDSIEIGNKVIVWARFREEIAQIAELCRDNKWRIVEYHGDTSKDDRAKARDDFQAGLIDVFIATQQAGSTGITLTACNHVIYYSNTFSAEDRWQSEDRAHRIGQTRSVLYEDLLAEDTIDEKIVNCLRLKKDVASLLMGDDARILLV